MNLTGSYSGNPPYPSASFTESYGGNLLTGSILDSTQVWKDRNSKNNGSFEAGVIGQFTTGSVSYQTPTWRLISIDNWRKVNIIESIFAPKDTTPGFNPNFLNTAAGYKLMYDRVQVWADLLCKCLGNFEYITLDFTFYWLFGWGEPTIKNKNRGNLKVTRTFTIRKSFRGKCIIETDDLNTTRGIRANSPGESDLPYERLINVNETNGSVTSSYAEYLRMPSFTSSASVEDYYNLETNSTSSMRVPGLLYFNTGDSNVYVYNGETWTSIGGQSELSRFTQSIGNATASIFVVTHSKNTRDVMVTVRETGTPYEIVYPTVYATSVNTIALDFSPTVPSVNQYTVIVV
jgi:hypothetical protein